MQTKKKNVIRTIYFQSDKKSLNVTYSIWTEFIGFCGYLVNMHNK